MSERFDLYLQIHKSLRNCMTATLVRLGRIDVEDPADVADAVGQLRDMIAALAAHLRIENESVHTVVAGRRPGALGSLPDEHEHHERSFAMLETDGAALLGATTEPLAARRERAHRLYLAVSRFVAENFVHMAFEESELNPQLWEMFTDAELFGIYQQILASEPPEAMTRAVRWMIPALTPAERARTVIGARGSIPPPVFAQVLGTVRALISPSEWNKLEAALG